MLGVCFGADDNEAFSAGMDWQVKKYVGIDLIKFFIFKACG